MEIEKMLNAIKEAEKRAYEAGFKAGYELMKNELMEEAEANEMLLEKINPKEE